MDLLEGCEAQLKDCCEFKPLQAGLPHQLLAKQTLEKPS